MSAVQSQRRAQACSIGRDEQCFKSNDIHVLVRECWLSVNERVWSRPDLYEKCPEITGMI